MPFCSNCGEKLADGAKFCSGCGTRVAQPAQPAPVEQPMPEVQEVKIEEKTIKTATIIITTRILIIQKTKKIIRTIDNLQNLRLKSKDEGFCFCCLFLFFHK